MQYSIGIATEQSFRYVELTDVKIWISKNASLRRVFGKSGHIYVATETDMYVICMLYVRTYAFMYCGYLFQ